MFQNWRYYSESTRENDTIFISDGHSVAAIWTGNNMFLFDSHSGNTGGTHNSNWRAAILSFSTFRQLGNYIKSFHEISSNISSETQYDLQYISIETTDEIKNKIVIKVRTQA